MYERDVEIHGLVALLAAVWFHETRTATLDLDLAAGFLLNVFDVVTSATDNLCSQIEAADRFETYGKLLFRPFALELGLAKCSSRAAGQEHVHDQIHRAQSSQVHGDGSDAHLPD